MERWSVICLKHAFMPYWIAALYVAQGFCTSVHLFLFINLIQAQDRSVIRGFDVSLQQDNYTQKIKLCSTHLPRTTLQYAVCATHYLKCVLQKCEVHTL